MSSLGPAASSSALWTVKVASGSSWRASVSSAVCAGAVGAAATPAAATRAQAASAHARAASLRVQGRREGAGGGEGEGWGREGVAGGGAAQPPAAPPLDGAAGLLRAPRGPHLVMASGLRRLAGSRAPRERGLLCGLAGGCKGSLSQALRGKARVKKENNAVRWARLPQMELQRRPAVHVAPAVPSPCRPAPHLLCRAPGPCACAL